MLDPKQLNGTYRWVNNTGGINPTLEIVKGKSFVIKIDNPTGDEHQLLIENSKGSKVGDSKEIKPGNKAEFEFKTDKSGDLKYHCEYHPDTMKGKIKVIE
jgi:plastocyanin